MPSLSSFLTISTDGYFTDRNGDMSWAHNSDPEFDAFVAGNASGNGALLFGRVTYEMMASFWPTPQAAQMMPEVAAGMNRMAKYVASRSLSSVDWDNSELLKGELVEAVRQLKAGDGPDIAILGSGSIISQLAQAGLIDEYQFVIAPLALGGGRSAFEGMDGKLGLTLVESRTFQNGNVFLRYRPR